MSIIRRLYTHWSMLVLYRNSRTLNTDLVYEHHTKDYPVSLLFLFDMFITTVPVSTRPPVMLKLATSIFSPSATRCRNGFGLRASISGRRTLTRDHAGICIHLHTGYKDGSIYCYFPAHACGRLLTVIAPVLASMWITSQTASFQTCIVDIEQTRLFCPDGLWSTTTCVCPSITARWIFSLVNSITWSSCSSVSFLQVEWDGPRCIAIL